MDEKTIKIKRQVRDFFNKSVKDEATLRAVAKVIGFTIPEPKITNYLEYMDKHLPKLFPAFGVDFDDVAKSVVNKYSNECVKYRDHWEAAGIHFYHGCALYMLTFIEPYASFCRETPSGWVSPGKWVLELSSDFTDVLKEFTEDLD